MGGSHLFPLSWPTSRGQIMLQLVYQVLEHMHKATTH